MDLPLVDDAIGLPAMDVYTQVIPLGAGPLGKSCGSMECPSLLADCDIRSTQMYRGGIGR